MKKSTSDKISIQNKSKIIIKKFKLNVLLITKQIKKVLTKNWNRK